MDYERMEEAPNLIGFQDVSATDEFCRLQDEGGEDQGASEEPSVTKLSLSRVYDEIGGFGHLQVLLLCVISIVRTFGQNVVYGLGLAFATPQFVCKDDSGGGWTKCSQEDICAPTNTMQPTYKLDESRDGYFINWITKYDLVCADPKEYTTVGSVYFLGFACGLLLFTIPDYLGRKRSMQIVMPLYCIASALSILASQMWLKKIGFFMLGLFHIKSTISYQHSYELMPNGWNSVASTVINVVDCLTLLIIGFSLKYFTHDITDVFVGFLVAGVISTILYLVFIPESPKWVFIMEGPQSQRGIDILNYIAWFNGSEYRVPANAHFDLENDIDANDVSLLGQTAHLHHSVMVNVSAMMQTSIIAQQKRSKKNDGGICSMIRSLYCRCGHFSTSMHLRLTLLFIAVLNTEFLSLFSSSELQGNPLDIGIVFGIAETLGAYASERMLQMMTDDKLQIICLVVIMLLRGIIKIMGLADEALFMAFIPMIFTLGASYNLIYIMHETRTTLHLQSVSLEFIQCTGMFTGQIAPVIGKSAEPLPTIGLCAASVLGIIATLILGNVKRAQTEMKHDVSDLGRSTTQMIVMRDLMPGETSFSGWTYALNNTDNMHRDRREDRLLAKWSQERDAEGGEDNELD